MNSLIKKNKKIGIICGSGPEAGMHLWNLILNETRKLFGEGFQGDIDMPYVQIISDPRLGESMEIINQDQKNRLWQILDEDICKLEKSVDYFIIACYTLHIFEPEIMASSVRKHKFLSLTKCLSSAMLTIDENDVALFHANVLYPDLCPLHSSIIGSKKIELPKEPAELRNLIFDIKIKGPDNLVVKEKFAELINACTANTIILGCSELSLMKRLDSSKKIIDCMSLIANYLIYDSTIPELVRSEKKLENT